MLNIAILDSNNFTETSPTKKANFKITILYNEDSQAAKRQFHADLVAGMKAFPKYIPGKYVYDDAGSSKLSFSIVPSSLLWPILQSYLRRSLNWKSITFSVQSLRYSELRRISLFPK